MRMTMKTHITLLALAIASLSAFAAEVTGSSEATAKQEGGALIPAAPQARGQDSQGRRRAFGGPIELKPDDKPAFPDPPDGFDKARDGIAHGKLEMIE